MGADADVDTELRVFLAPAMMGEKGALMKGRRHTPEQIIRKLREAERMLGEGESIPEVAKSLGVSEQTFHRWRNQYGGMKAQDVKRLKELERENQRLKAIVADQALENCASGGLVGKLVGPVRLSASGGRDAARPSRRQRAQGMPGCRAAPLHEALRAHWEWPPRRGQSKPPRPPISASIHRWAGLVGSFRGELVGWRWIGLCCGWGSRRGRVRWSRSACFWAAVSVPVSAAGCGGLRRGGLSIR